MQSPSHKREEKNPTTKPLLCAILCKIAPIFPTSNKPFGSQRQLPLFYFNFSTLQRVGVRKSIGPMMNYLNSKHVWYRNVMVDRNDLRLYSWNGSSTDELIIWSDLQQWISEQHFFACLFIHQFCFWLREEQGVTVSTASRQTGSDTRSQPKVRLYGGKKSTKTCHCLCTMNPAVSSVTTQANWGHFVV